MVTTNSFAESIKTLSTIAVSVLDKEKEISENSRWLIRDAVHVLRPIAKYLRQDLNNIEFMGKRIEVHSSGIFLGAILDQADGRTVPVVMTGYGKIEIPYYSAWTEAMIFHVIEQQTDERIAAIVETIHFRLEEMLITLASRLEKLTEREQKLKALKEFLAS